MTFFGDLPNVQKNRGGGAIFFSARRIAERLKREFPAMTVCGTYSPPFRDSFTTQENDSIVDLINRSRPDVLWVGMTAPKQEKWVQQHRHRLQVPCIAAVGAVFDFYSGIKKRSPEFWQRLGLEWLHRLVREPFRLWERSVVSAPIFLLMVFKEVFLRQLFIRHHTPAKLSKQRYDGDKNRQSKLKKEVENGKG